MTTGDGTCVLEFDQTEKGSIISDETTGNEMSSAASYLIGKCASVQAKDRGGIATGLGKSKYQPPLQTSILMLKTRRGARPAQLSRSRIQAQRAMWDS